MLCKEQLTTGGGAPVPGGGAPVPGGAGQGYGLIARVCAQRFPAASDKVRRQQLSVTKTLRDFHKGRLGEQRCVPCPPQADPPQADPPQADPPLADAGAASASEQAPSRTGGAPAASSQSAKSPSGGSTPPPNARSNTPPSRRAGSPLGALRRWFLYTYLPYDRTIWGRLRSPSSVALMAVAAAPYWPVRAAFFALLLLALLPELDEYQLFQFIQSLKGSQFIQGVLLALQGFGYFFRCAVLARPASCDTAGPGVSLEVYDGAAVNAVALLVLQALAWAAFFLLPHSTQCGALSLLGRREKNKPPAFAPVAPLATRAAVRVQVGVPRIDLPAQIVRITASDEPSLTHGCNGTVACSNEQFS